MGVMMQRIPNKSSSQQSLVILILIVLIIVAISTNVTLAWFYSRATSSRVEIISELKIATQILNGQSLNFNEYELFPDSIIERTLRIQKDSEEPTFYLRIRPEIRIDGITTTAIAFNISEQDEPYWLPATYSNTTWYYCYTDFDSWDLLDEWLPSLHMQFHISPNIVPERLERVLTVIVYVEAVAIDGNIDHWQDLPEGWPFVAQEPQE